MQEERILKKASRLGISIDTSLSNEENINSIASSYGLDSSNLNVLENRLDNELAVNSYGEFDEYSGGESTGDFGEKEYNAARDENGVYDSNYYSNRQKELDQKVEEAKAEKDRDYKKTDDEPIKDDGSNTIGKNKFEKLKGNIDLANAKKNQFFNKVNDAKSKIYEATHPEDILKNKVDEVKENIKDKAKQKIKESGKEVTKKATSALVSFIKKNPYVLAAIAILFFILLITIIIGGNVNTAGNEQLDTYCDSKDKFNFSLKSTALSREDFVNKALSFFESHPNYHPNCQKALNSREALTTIYDTSLANNISPEVTIARAIAEGCSPGTGIGVHTGECQYNTVGKNRGVGSFTYDWDTSYNYWGIQTFPGTWTSPSGQELHNDWSCYAAIYDKLEDGVVAFAQIVSKYETATEMMKVYAGQVNEEQAEAKAKVMADIRDTIFYDGNYPTSGDDCSRRGARNYDYGNYVFKIDANGSVNVNNPPKYISQSETKNFNIKEVTNGDISSCSCQSASFSMIILALGNVNYIIEEKGIPLATSSSCPEINKYHATIHYYMVGLNLQYGGWHSGASGNRCGGIQQISAISEEDRKGLGIKIGPKHITGNADKMIKYLRNGWLIQYHITPNGCALGSSNCQGLGQTNSGHYGLIYGYDSTKNVFLVHDNGNASRESATASYDVVNNYLSDFFPISVYGKEDI